MQVIIITGYECFFDDEVIIDPYTLSVYDNGRGVKRLVYSSGEYASKYYSRVYMNANKNILVDHKDGNPLNNCLWNLRIATRGQNCYNTEPHANKKDSLPKGIQKIKEGYRVRASADGARYSLGTFKSLDLAVEAHKDFVEKWHGEFAYHKSRQN